MVLATSAEPVQSFTDCYQPVHRLFGQVFHVDSSLLCCHRKGFWALLLDLLQTNWIFFTVMLGIFVPLNWTLTAFYCCNPNHRRDLSVTWKQKGHSESNQTESRKVVAAVSQILFRVCLYNIWVLACKIFLFKSNVFLQEIMFGH